LDKRHINATMPGPGKPFTSITAIEAGKKGGPKGKRKSHDQVMREWLQLTIKELKYPIISKLAQQLKISEDSTIDDLFRFSLLTNGMKGNVRAITEAFNRGFGRGKMEVDITSGGQKLQPMPLIVKLDVDGVKKVKPEIKKKNA